MAWTVYVPGFYMALHGTWVNRGVAMSNKTDRIAPDQPGATTDLTGANTVATRTVPDYPGLKNRPGPSRLTPEILSILIASGEVSRTMSDHPGLSRIKHGSEPRIGQMSCAGRSEDSPGRWCD